MNWFNYLWLIFVVLLLIPNIVFALSNKMKQNKQISKSLQIFEQIGRFGSMLFMIFNVPYTFWEFYFAHAEIIYIAVNSALMLGYYVSWLIYWKKECLARILLLSCIPSVIFIFSGIMFASIPLIIFAIIFSIFHIWISVKN